MQKPVFSVRDASIRSFVNPFVSQTTELAIRSFRNQCVHADAASALAQQPEDFELWHLGFFDEETGEMECAPPRAVARALDYAKGK